MRILVCGANGFIGRHLCAALAASGHDIVRGVRTARTADEIAIDYMRDLDPQVWLPRLRGIDVVVNAVGILAEEPGKTFNAIHREAPIALFTACVSAGIRKVIQISALGGSDPSAWTDYMRSKREADAWLAQSSLDATILRPSLVVGVDGESSRFFRMLASLPVIGLPGRGDQQLQPVHIDDLCDAVVQALSEGPATRTTIDVVGPAQMSYRAMLQTYRQSMALADPVWLPIPMAIMTFTAKLAGVLPQKVFSPDTLRMLQQDNVADPAPVARLLGRAPRSAASWFAGTSGEMLRAQAIAAWSRPMLQVALVIVWIVTGLLSLGIYPVDQSLALLNAVGLRGSVAMIALYGAAALDIAFGVATLVKPSRLLWRLQMLLIAGYTVIISIWLPAFWLHPFGPVLKNLPILAILILLDASQTRKQR